MKKKRKTQPMPSDLFESKVISGTECTGLMPSLPQNDEEADASAQLYNIHPSGSAKDDDVPFGKDEN